MAWSASDNSELQVIAVARTERPPEGSALDRRIEDPRITESSGLALSQLHPGILWTHNDSGDSARIFAIAADGSTAATYDLPGAPVRDWEAIAPCRDAAGEPVLWIGDIGDNLSSWRSVRLLRAREPEALADGAREWQRFDVAYEDGPRNAEALLCDPANGRLYVATKETAGAGLYAVPAAMDPTSRATMQRIGEVPSVITDGAFSPDGSRVALVDYVYAWIYGWTGEGLAPDPRRIVLPPRGQGESVTWTADGSALLVGSEGSRSAVWRVPITAQATASPSPTATASGSPTSPGSTTASPLPTEPLERGDRPPLWLWLGGALAAVLALGVARRSHRRPPRP